MSSQKSDRGKISEDLEDKLSNDSKETEKSNTSDMNPSQETTKDSNTDRGSDSKSFTEKLQTVESRDDKEDNKTARKLPKKDEKAIPMKNKRFSVFMREVEAIEKELTFDNLQRRFTGDEDKSKELIVERSKQNTLSSGMAAIFIVSSTTGVAMRGLSYALKDSGWFGVFLIILLAIHTLYASMCLGWSWIIMEENWPEYQNENRTPLPEMAFRAFGKIMQYFVKFLVDMTLFLTAAAYLVAIAGSVESWAHTRVEFCVMVIVAVCVLVPFILRGSYKDIIFVGVFDVFVSFLYVALLIVGFFLDPNSEEKSSYSDPSYQSLSLAFAGFSFAYGSGAITPSIMADMEDRSLFPQATVTATIIVLLLYTVLPILGYAAYGDRTPDNIVKFIIGNDSLVGLGIAIKIIFVLQVMSTFIVAFIPFTHSLEASFKLPNKSGLKRILCRVLIMLILMLIVLGYPNVDKLVNFVGATVMNFLTIMLPPIIYVSLLYKRNVGFSKGVVSVKEWVLLIEMVALGTVLGVIATYVTIINYSKSSNRHSCYLDMHSSLPETWLNNTF